MHPFGSYVLRSYFRSTGWNEDNLYANLTRSSNAILDFSVPRGFHFSVSKSANDLFRTSYTMNAMPSLNGSMGYIFTSCDLDIKGSGNVRFKDMVERFKVYDQPRKPEGKDEEWLAGERVDRRDYLLYGRFYLPTGRLDAVYSTRIAPTFQATVAAISDPRSRFAAEARVRDTASNLMISLQHDTGRWCTECTWSADDGMWGVRLLHNFGKLNRHADVSAAESTTTTPKKVGVKRIDEEELAAEGGLRGRISAGAEFYFSAKEKSAGVSTGIRFTTLPDATPPSFQIPPPSSSPLALASSSNPPSQPPTTITALFNPMLGHISGAYSARVSRDTSLSSRFDFNVYSYESEWTMGGEWWIRKALPMFPMSLPDNAGVMLVPRTPSPSSHADEDIHGVVKARASTNSTISLMWEGRLRNMLVSLGTVCDFSGKGRPVQALGLELSYFSSSNS